MGRVEGKMFQVEGIICMKALRRKRVWHIPGTKRQLMCLKIVIKGKCDEISLAWCRS